MTFPLEVISTKKQWWSKNTWSFRDRKSVIRNPSSCCWLEWLLLPDLDDSIVDHRALADGWVAKPSVYLKWRLQSFAGGLIHLSGWHPNRFGGERGSERGKWISPDQGKSRPGTSVLRRRGADIQIRSGSACLWWMRGITMSGILTVTV